jgi:very-short-patch-repair endonuclease
LAIEYDGAQHRENLIGDNRRQNRLVDAGFRLLRFTAADVLSAPDSVVALVRRAVSAGTSTVQPIGFEGRSIPSFPNTRPGDV